MFEPAVVKRAKNRHTPSDNKHFVNASLSRESRSLKYTRTLHLKRFVVHFSHCRSHLRSRRGRGKVPCKSSFVCPRCANFEMTPDLLSERKFSCCARRKSSTCVFICQKTHSFFSGLTFLNLLACSILPQQQTSLKTRTILWLICFEVSASWRGGSALCHWQTCMPTVFQVHMLSFTCTHFHTPELLL